MKSYISDITAEYNANTGVKRDVSAWQNVTIQVVGPSGNITLTGTNDANAFTGISDGSAVSSGNYTAIQATNLADGTPVTSINTAGLYNIQIKTKFIQLGGGGAPATKVILFFNKPY
jgi:hypothetical protein